jgi:phosphoribosylformylglycinamidine synthase
MKFGIVVFPGSNCDQDCYHVARELLGQQAEYVWHRDTDLRGADVVILPGGFAYGDYLRAGALARFSPVMGAVASFAGAGGPVLGICNGFQVLLEAGLLPGAVRVNRGLRYVCRDVYLRVERADTAFTSLYDLGEVVKMPIGHMEGNYTAPPETLAGLERRGQVAFRYCDVRGNLVESANPNGAADAIAGLANPEGNVVGLMPHPDRCSENLLGNEAGRRMFESAVRAAAQKEALGVGR